MNDQIAATALAALGHEARLKVFRLLVRAGPDGLRVGDIGTVLGIPPSTLKHHLNQLLGAGLIAQERQGREIINRAAFDAMHSLLGYVYDQCCEGVVLDDDAVA